MVHVAICDDIIEEAQNIAALLDIYQEERPGVLLRSHIFTSPDVLLDSISSGQCFDIFLLDIVMPKMDGITLAQKIRRTNNDASLIFLTHSSSFALDAFSVFAAQYILKPADRDKLFMVLDKLVTTHFREKESFIAVSAPGRTVTLLHSSIIVTEHAGRVLRYHLTTGDFIESKAIRTPFETAVSDLLKDSRFLRVHQSYVINMAYVLELRTRYFIMTNGLEVPIPRPKFAAVKRIYLKYLADISARKMERPSDEDDG